MGQAHSHFEKPTGFWHRQKSKAAKREPSQNSFTQMPPPHSKVDYSSAQTDQSFVYADQSSTTTNATPASPAPLSGMHGDAMEETSGKVGETDSVDKVEERTSSPLDQPMTDKPDEPDNTDLPTQASEESTSVRPALKRKHTPPHHIQIWTKKAWQIEHAYANVHDHVTKTLNKIRKQQQQSQRKAASSKKTEMDVYKAADSCTLALEYLVGNFSTRFFHHAGPENIMGMMATIDADATALDDLRLKQLQMANYGYNLEKKIAETEGHIRELAELAKRIRDEGSCGKMEGDMDADGDTDPEANGKKENGGGTSY